MLRARARAANGSPSRVVSLAGGALMLALTLTHSHSRVHSISATSRARVCARPTPLVPSHPLRRSRGSRRARTTTKASRPTSATAMCGGCGLKPPSTKRRGPSWAPTSRRRCSACAPHTLSGARRQTSSSRTRHSRSSTAYSVQTSSLTRSSGASRRGTCAAAWSSRTARRRGASGASGVGGMSGATKNEIQHVRRYDISSVLSHYKKHDVPFVVCRSHLGGTSPPVRRLTERRNERPNERTTVG